jgi:hypothetical protein
MAKPVSGTYPAFTEGYINLVQVDTVTEAIAEYGKPVTDFFYNLPQNKLHYRYAPGKWNLKEVLQHVIDTERILAYRALTLARHDQTPLPGFNENAYAAASNASARSWDSLLEEFEVTRRSGNLLLQSFNQEQLSRSGITNNEPNTVNALGFIIFGHILHHINIINERYL